MNNDATLSAVADENEEKSICGIFTESEIESWHDEYMKFRNRSEMFDRIATRIFRHFGIRTLDALLDSEEENEKKKAHRIRAYFGRVQALVVRKVLHTRSGEIEVPYYDTDNNASADDRINKMLDNHVAEPDFRKLEKEMCENTDYERGCEIIRKIADYYQFANPETFVNRFSLFICNAKSKALNKQPKWPVLFSLAGPYGYGKGWLRTMLISTHDKTFSTQSQKTRFNRLLGQNSNFNAVMTTRGFVYFDEKEGINSTQAERLKTLITEPTVEIERKHRDPKTMRNLTTFISTTNESIKDVMGLQQDRRLVEFEVIGKTGEIPEKTMESWLMELWRVMPCEHPDPKAIIDELLEESKAVLDSRMEEIVAGIFERESEFVNSRNRVNRASLKEVIKNKYSSVRYQSFVSWCVGCELFRTYANDNNYYLNRKVLQQIMDKLTASVDETIDSMINGEEI